MRNISNLIEEHLKEILKKSKSDMIIVQRSELAAKFQCVPSQINYVISTRFTLEKGYIVESKRGGGGYIRIRKVTIDSDRQLYENIMKLIDHSITQQLAEGIIERLQEEDKITAREAAIMKAVVSREVLNFQIPVRDQLRANILKSFVKAVFFGEECEG